jgi:hypothetical protein
MSNDSHVAEREMTSALRASDVLERLPKFFSLALCSKRNVGKTLLMTEIIGDALTSGRVDVVIVMSGSAGMDDDYLGVLPKEFIMPFNESVLRNIWHKQRVTPREVRKHVLIVLDDCLATPEALQNPVINQFYALGRHNNISIAILSQHTKSLLSPIVRQNCDMILWSKLSRANLNILAEEVNNLSREDFIRVSEALSGVNHNFLLIDRWTKSTNPCEFISIVRAQWPAKYPPPEPPKKPD